MKLFVFTNVLCDYTSGMAVVRAEDRDDAIRRFNDRFPDHEAHGLGPVDEAIIEEIADDKVGVVAAIMGGG